LSDRTVRDLPDLLRAGDILVVNDTKVIPSRLKGRRGEAAIEVTLHQRDRAGVWRAFARPAKRLRPGDRIEFAAGLNAAVLSRDGGEVALDFALDDDALRAALESHGGMPLPPYIKREGLATGPDRLDYQTVYAARHGAVAAPTAGLHFTDGLLDRLEVSGVRRATVTLHVGAGTFLPVTAEDTEEHRMHAERGEIDRATADAINAARAAGGRIVAVGTTVLRLLESAADERGQIHPFDGETDIFITPGYAFRTAELLLTNFHLPKSTLFMLVSAFSGLERMKSAYAHAIAAGYRFYSYGDCCLLERSS
jgi:S-adenosylmethionine:tRNA ribosyltransferase-isomerase